MFKNKINKLTEKIDKIKNDIIIPLIGDFLDWFYNTLFLHFEKNEPRLFLRKGAIFFVNLGKNIGSELNKTRPCVIYSIKKANFGNTVLIIPIKTFKGQKLNDFQVFIKMSKENLLEKDSIIDISGIRQISKKRIFTKKGYLEENIISEVDSKIINIFGIKKENN